MKTVEVEVIPAPSVRRSLTTPGDIRSDIAFQNDINNLLARIEEVKLPWKAAARLVSFGFPGGTVAQPRLSSVIPPLRVFDGGGGSGTGTATGSASRPAVVAGPAGEPVADLPPPQRMRRRA